MFNGYKTYIVAAVAVLTGLEMYFVGGATLQEAAIYILNGLGLATLRHGVKTAAKP